MGEEAPNYTPPTFREKWYKPELRNPKAEISWCNRMAKVLQSQRTKRNSSG